MNINSLITEMLGGRDTSSWNELAEEIVYNNLVNERASLPFTDVYTKLLASAPPGSYLYWVKQHSNRETQNFRRRLKYRYDTFKSIREIVLYLHEQNYLSGKLGSPTPNEVEQTLGKDYIWYVPRFYTKEEKELLNRFLGRM